MSTPNPIGGMAGANIVGTIVDAVTTHSANQANVAQANANREFARNAHQIEVADLYKAGLNPMLSYRGQGASLGGGVMADVKPITRDTGEKINSAMMIQNQANLMKAQTGLATAGTAKAEAEALNINADTKLKRVHMIGGLASADQARTTADLHRAEIPRIEEDVKRITSLIKVQGMEAALKKAQAEGAMVETRLAQRTFYEVMEGIKNESLLKKYQAIEAELGAKAAQATWRIWLAEKGLTLTQIEKIMGALPNVALIYPLKTITNTTINPAKK